MKATNSLSSSSKSDNPIPQKVKDSLLPNNKTLEAIIRSSKNKNQLVKNYRKPGNKSEKIYND